jgi:putative ABC transport system permease protein
MKFRTTKETLAVARLTFRTVPRRIVDSMFTVFAVAMAAGLLATVLAMANGFRETLSTAGSEDVVVFTRAGSQAEVNSLVSADQVKLLYGIDGVKRSAKGLPLISAETYVVVDGINKASNTRANLTLRGISLGGAAVRDRMKIISGRMFLPGTNEVVVGRALSEEFLGLNLGDVVRFGPTRWVVVGQFELDGSVFESEIWGDSDVIQNVFHKYNQFQIVRAKLAHPSDLLKIKAAVDGDARLKLDVKSEASYYADQAKDTVELVRSFGWPLAAMVALGAIAGMLNTMYNSVRSRAREIAILRALGFSSMSAFSSTMLESLALGFTGVFVGLAMSHLLAMSVSAETLGPGFTQLVFKFRLSWSIVAQATLMATIIAFAGGLLPSLHARRLSIAGATQDGG